MKAEDLVKPTVAIAYVLLSLELAAEHGLDRAELLQGLEISETQLGKADARVPFLQYGRLCARILRRSGDAGLGYEFGLRSGLTVHGFMGLGILSQRTLRESVEFAIRYAPRVRSPGFDLRFVVEGAQAVLTLSETVQYGPLHQYAVDMQLVAAAAMLRTALGFEEMELWFSCAEPEHYARYRERLPAVRFGRGSNQLRFAARLLDRPLETANAVTAELVRNYCERESSLLDIGEDLPTRVRLLLANAQGRNPSLEAVAAQLSLSTRTLKRRLREHDSSFQLLTQEALLRDATRLLRETSLTIEQIAAQLGYSEAANFSRAYRKLSGRMPSELRPTAARGARVVPR